MTEYKDPRLNTSLLKRFNKWLSEDKNNGKITARIIDEFLLFTGLMALILWLVSCQPVQG